MTKEKEKEIYEILYIWTAEKGISEDMIDHRSFVQNY